MQKVQDYTADRIAEQIIDAIGGERLAGSGFENERTEPAYVDDEE